MIFLQLFLYFIHFLEYNSYYIEKLYNFKKTYFRLNSEYLIFEYSNNITMTFGAGAIFFIFEKGYKPSTNIYLYDSYDKIEKGGIGFNNYIYQTTLKETQYFEINSVNIFFKENITYYILLYDIYDSYEDYIYVVNTLDFFPLYDFDIIYYVQKIDKQLNFNFIIPKHSYGYLHYQSRKDPFNVLGSSSYYYFKIVDGNGTIYIDSQINGVADYIKLDSNLEYYIQIAIIRSRYYYIKPSSFMLSFTSYGENFWLQDDDIYLEALSPQHYSFFKNISDLKISDKILFNGDAKRGDFGECYYYIKYYDSDNFERLIDIFPKRREDFDSQISASKYCGNFNFEIQKKNIFQKGILIGIFLDSPYEMYEMDPISLTIYGDSKNNKKEEEENQEKDEKSDDKDYSKNDNKSNYTWLWVLLSIFFICCCCCSGIFCCNNSSKTNEDFILATRKIQIQSYNYLED